MHFSENTMILITITGNREFKEISILSLLKIVTKYENYQKSLFTFTKKNILIC